ncbi:MAG: hypothetical protein M0P66_13445 [Salinivirgaceae bacterium]|nr:hypothetical protein [Salinivirgaceae bacterium]
MTIEQITAIAENKRAIGPKKDILEVKNAIAVYDYLDKLNPYNFDWFCEAHGILMNGLLNQLADLEVNRLELLKALKLLILLQQVICLSL